MNPITTIYSALHTRPLLPNQRLWSGLVACGFAAGLTFAASITLAACTAEAPLAPEATNTPAAPDSLGTFELTFTAATTRATTTVITKEEANNFLVTILKGTDTIRTATRLRDLNTSLSAGYGYRVMAENCTTTEAITVNDGWGQKRFAGTSAAFAIRAGQTTAVNVGCSVANAAVEVVFDESVGEYFTEGYDVTLRDGSRTIAFDASTGGHRADGTVTDKGRTAYFNLDADGTHQVAYTITARGPKTLTREGTLTLTKAKISNITLDYERSTFDFAITLDEQELLITEILNITDDDIHVEDGTTTFNATLAPLTTAPTTSPLHAPATTTPHHAPAPASVALPAAVPPAPAVTRAAAPTLAWQPAASVAVFDFQSAKRTFAATTISGSRATFEGQLTAKSPAFAAIYPHDLAASTATSAATLAATLPTTQRAVAGDIDAALTIAVAKAQRNLDGSPAEVTFHHATQLLAFTIPAYAEDRISSILLTATTPVAGRLNIDYSGTTPAITIPSTESRTINILPPTGVTTFEAGTYYIAAAPTQIPAFTLTYTANGRTYTQASTAALGGTPGCTYDLATIDLINTPAATATHTYADGLLTGTDVALSGAPIEGRTWTVTIINAAGTTVRTASGSGNLTSPATDNATWPFLPQGTYTVRYTFTDSNGDSRTETTTLTVAAPALTLTVDGYTAHTRYEAGDIDGANACERLTFYAPSARLNVAPALMANANYTRTFQRTFNGQTATTTETTNTPAWANYTGTPVSASLYTFTVTANFGGTQVTASKSVRITGLPANFTPPTQATGWANDRGTTDFNGDHVRLGNYSFSQPHRIKNESWFNIPAGTRMSLDYDIVLHRAAVNTTANVKVGSQQVVYCDDSKYNDDVHNTGVQAFTTQAAVTSVTCEGSYGSGATCTKVYKLFFQYAK